MDMNAAPQNGTVIIAMARYPQARAGFPRFVQYDGKTRKWYAVSGIAATIGDVVICWAWMPREVLPYWPDEPGRVMH